MYHYAGNNPVKYTDPDGRSAGDLFDTMDETALDFAITYNDDSLKLNKELGASIYKNSEGKYFYSIPSKGFKASVSPSKIFGEKRVGIIHTHTEGFQMDNYSDTDLSNAQREKVISYLVISDGGLLKFNPSKRYNIGENPREINSHGEIPQSREFHYQESKILSNKIESLRYFFFGEKK